MCVSPNIVCSSLTSVNDMKMTLSIGFVLFFYAAVAVADRVVMTNNGPVQGITVSTTGEKIIEAFLGVPYAEPPVGRLRFGRPVPKTSWMGVHDASSLPPPCIQNVTGERYYFPNVENMTEDCLYLNLWVPYTKKDTKLKPVIVYFHGGAFYHASTSMKIFDGTKLARFGDVLMVTINYRVGAMGFFSSSYEDARGNMGIYDLLLGTQWVKANVKSFGGDPNHLVLMGESAGSMIVGGFLTSPLTKNLFKRVIMQSGSSMQTMILDNNVFLHKNGHKLSALVGCADRTLTLQDSPKLVVDCLKRVPAKDIAMAEGSMLMDIPVSFYPSTGDEFMPVASIYYYKQGIFQDMEMLLGINEEEGNIFLTVSVPVYFGVYGQDNVKTFNKRLSKQLLMFMYKKMDRVENKDIAEYYTNIVVNASSDAYTKAMGLSVGDFMIVCNSYFTAEMYAVRNPVYFYVFTRRPSSTPLADWLGVTHFDEMQYVFGNPLFENFTQEEQALSLKLMSRWIAFAKTGNPNVPDEVEWPLFSWKDPKYLQINDSDSVQTHPDNNRCEFWRDKYQADFDELVISNAVSSAYTSSSLRTTASVGWILISASTATKLFRMR